MRLFLKQLWSTYYFYVLYANANSAALEADQPAATPGPREPTDDLDRWALSRTAGTAAARSRAAGRLRRDLRRPGDRGVGRRALELVRAPLAPALLGWRAGGVRDTAHVPAGGREAARAAVPVHRRRDLRQPRWRRCASVHLCDFPAAAEIGARDEELEEAMALARETVRLGLGARGKAKIKVRQPLREAVVVADGRERAAIERLADVVREELNVTARALRRRRGGARQLRGEGQLPHARAAVRQATCRWRRRRSRRSTPPTWPPPCATAGHDRDRRRRPRAHALGGRCDPDDEGARRLQRRARGRPRGGARARRSTSAARARAAPARSSTPSRTRARARACEVEDRIALALARRPRADRGRRGAPRLHRGRDARRRARAPARRAGLSRGDETSLRAGRDRRPRPRASRYAAVASRARAPARASSSGMRRRPS